MEQHQERDRAFSAQIADIYETQLVPMLFAPYAEIMAREVAARAPRRVLEVAAGTGVVTRALASHLPSTSELTATDLNQPMLDRAMAIGTSRPVTWRTADAMALPFGDGEVDAIVCQFGAMFFPDRPRAFAEARRVLAPGGSLFFSVWDRIEENEFADVVTSTAATLFPDDPPSFLRRTPHGYFDLQAIADDLRAGGFDEPATFLTVPERSRAASAEQVAIAYCEGTPLRNEIEARAPQGLAEVTRVVADALARRFGDGAVDGLMQAHLIIVDR